MSKEKSLRERREDNEKKRLARQSLPNSKELGNTKGSSREKKPTAPSNNLNTRSRNKNRDPKSKVDIKVNSKKSFWGNILSSVSLFVKEKTWLFLTFTLLLTVLTFVVLYNFSSIIAFLLMNYLFDNSFLKIRIFG
jgi:hypothetical protein